MYSDTERQVNILGKSRADYFRERRKKLKDFGVLVDRQKLERIVEKVKFTF